jgi:hypothetical protein
MREYPPVIQTALIVGKRVPRFERTALLRTAVLGQLASDSDALVDLLCIIIERTEAFYDDRS